MRSNQGSPALSIPCAILCRSLNTASSPGSHRSGRPRRCRSCPQPGRGRSVSPKSTRKAVCAANGANASSKSCLGSLEANRAIDTVRKSFQHAALWFVGTMKHALTLPDFALCTTDLSKPLGGKINSVSLCKSLSSSHQKSQIWKTRPPPPSHSALFQCMRGVCSAPAER